jgi:hypothetical protein
MADAVTSQTITDGAGLAVMKFTNISDGTGESAVLKVDASTLGASPNDLTIEKIFASTTGMSVDILWDATTDVIAWHIPADRDVTFDFGREHALRNNAGAGKTGDIMFTTIGHSSGDRYSIVLHMRKRTV